MQIASILLAVLASTSVLASKNSPVDVVFSRQCNGNYQVLPKLPFGMAIDVPALERAFTGAFAKLRDRAKCQCSGLSDNDFDLMFDPITGVLNAASANTKYPTVPAGCAGLFPRNLTDLADAVNVNFPSTCNLDIWQTTGECSAKYNWSSQIQFGIALKKCPGSRIPALTVNCIGCTDLAKPCMADSDCGKHKCNTVTPWTSHQESVLNWFDAFKHIGFFDEGDASPGCSQNKFQPTASNDMLTSALSFFKNEIYGDAGEVTEIKFCGIDQFTNADMTGLISVVDHPLTPKRCYAPNDFTAKEITVTNLMAWPEGQSVLALAPILPPPNIAPASAGRLRFFQMTCDGQFSLFNGGARVRMGQNYIKSFEKLGRMLYAMQKCRRNGSLMLSQFLTRFGMWTLYPYLYSFDGNTFPDQYDLGPAMSDLVTQMFTRHRIDYPNDPYNGYQQPSRLPSFLFGLPDTCNFEHLLKTGACSAQFSGISSLLNVNVQAELHATTCAATSGDTPMFMQSFAIDMTCGGNEPCTLTPLPCDTNYDCPSNFECMDIKKMIPQPDYSSGDLIGDYLFPIRDKDIQPDGMSGTLCSASNVGYQSDLTCGGALKDDQDMSYIVAQIFGIDPTKMSQNGGIKICNVDQQAFNGSTVSNWAKTQVQSKENGIVLANLHPVAPPSELLIGSASPPSDPIPIKDYPTSNSSILTASAGVGLAAMLFAFMLI